MAGSRNFRIDTISRSDLMALTEDAARVSGVPYVMDAYREEAEAIIDDASTQDYIIGGKIPLGDPTAILRLLRDESQRHGVPTFS